MKFLIQHARAIAGNDLVIGIETEGDELISRVTIALDGFDIADDSLDRPSVSYERQMLQAGSASPHLEHQLTVTVTDPDGKSKVADRRWQDAT